MKKSEEQKPQIVSGLYKVIMEIMSIFNQIKSLSLEERKAVLERIKEKSRNERQKI